MSKQKYVFLQDEGDHWFERNSDKIAMYDIEADPVVAAIRKLDIKPKRVLEIGCGTGHRLASLRFMYKCDIMGVEPSREAGMAAAAQRVPVVQSTASSPAVSTPFDMVIYGHCLYLTDPEDWLQIAAEANNVLTPGGHIIIHDFWPVSPPFKRRYEHRDGIWSYHFDWARLWLGHPAYSVILQENVGDDQSVAVLRKGEMP